MKYTLIIISAALLFTSCKKKVESGNCYLCTKTKTHTSTIPALVNPAVGETIDTICKFTEARIRAYEKDNVYSDTIFVYKDTVVIENYKSTCILE